MAPRLYVAILKAVERRRSWSGREARGVGRECEFGGRLGLLAHRAHGHGRIGLLHELRLLRGCRAAVVVVGERRRVGRAGQGGVRDVGAPARSPAWRGGPWRSCLSRMTIVSIARQPGCSYVLVLGREALTLILTSGATDWCIAKGTPFAARGCAARVAGVGYVGLFGLACVATTDLAGDAVVECWPCSWASSSSSSDTEGCDPCAGLVVLVVVLRCGAAALWGRRGRCRRRVG